MTPPTHPEMTSGSRQVASVVSPADRRSCALLEHRPRRLPRFPQTRVLARCWRGGTEISPDRRAGRIRPPCASPIAAIEQIPHSCLGNFKEAEGGCPQLLNHSSPPSG